MGQEHPRMPGNWSPGRPVFPVEGDDAWGAHGCGVRCGSHGDPGQVIHLNLPPDLLEHGPWLWRLGLLGRGASWGSREGWERTGALVGVRRSLLEPVVGAHWVSQGCGPSPSEDETCWVQLRSLLLLAQLQPAGVPGLLWSWQVRVNCTPCLSGEYTKVLVS